MAEKQEPRHDDLWREEMDHKVDTVLQRVNKIFDVVCGTQMGTKEQKAGMVGMIEDLTARLESVESKIFATKWVIVGLVGPAGYGLFQFIREYLINNHK